MKKAIIAAFLTTTVLTFTGAGFAAGVGYVDYNKVSTQYSLAKTYSANLDKKIEAIKTYAESQDKKAAAAKTDAERKQIRTDAIKNVRVKQQDYVTTRNRYEADLTAKVVAAAEKVRVSKNLDVILKKDARVTGGVDCTQDVLNILK